jgi:FAR-17a/AIG1-like protein
MLELFTSFRSYPSRKSGLTGLIVFLAGYLVWVHVIKHYSGVWVYPVLDVLALPQRIAFFAANLLIVVFLYLSGEFMNEKIWTKEMKQIKQQSGKKAK